MHPISYAAHLKNHLTWSSSLLFVQIITHFVRTNSAQLCRNVKMRVPGSTPEALSPATRRVTPSLKDWNVHLKYGAFWCPSPSGMLGMPNKSCGWPTLASARLSGHSSTVSSNKSQADRICAGRGGPWTSLTLSSECGILNRSLLPLAVECTRRAIEGATSYQPNCCAHQRGISVVILGNRPASLGASKFPVFVSAGKNAAPRRNH